MMRYKICAKSLELPLELLIAFQCKFWSTNFYVRRTYGFFYSTNDLTSTVHARIHVALIRESHFGNSRFCPSSILCNSTHDSFRKIPIWLICDLARCHHFMQTSNFKKHWLTFSSNSEWKTGENDKFNRNCFIAYNFKAFLHYILQYLHFFISRFWIFTFPVGPSIDIFCLISFRVFSYQAFYRNWVNCDEYAYNAYKTATDFTFLHNLFWCFTFDLIWFQGLLQCYIFIDSSISFLFKFALCWVTI